MIEPKFLANGVVFYYQELAQAATFYQNTLGLKRMEDDQNGILFQISPTTFIRLQEQQATVAWSTAPKSVTLSFITEEIDAWHDYLTHQGVAMHKPLANATRHPTRGFVALDPEGYFLEFETFLPHEQNQLLNARLAEQQALYPTPKQQTNRPTTLGLQGNVIWLYYRDIPAAEQFYQQVMGLERVTDQGFAKIYAASDTGFVGLVDGAQGLHQFAEEKAVVLHLVTERPEEWRQRLIEQARVTSVEQTVEKGYARMTARDVGNYVLRFDSP